MAERLHQLTFKDATEKITIENTESSRILKVDVRLSLATHDIIRN